MNAVKKQAWKREVQRMRLTYTPIVSGIFKNDEAGRYEAVKRASQWELLYRLPAHFFVDGDRLMVSLYWCGG